MSTSFTCSPSISPFRTPAAPGQARTHVPQLPKHLDGAPILEYPVRARRLALAERPRRHVRLVREDNVLGLIGARAQKRE
jgi:hypothetical protein